MHSLYDADIERWVSYLVWSLIVPWTSSNKAEPNCHLTIEIDVNMLSFISVCGFETDPTSFSVSFEAWFHNDSKLGLSENPALEFLCDVFLRNTELFQLCSLCFISENGWWVCGRIWEAEKEAEWNSIKLVMLFCTAFENSPCYFQGWG